jgi:hypothetical protein
VLRNVKTKLYQVKLEDGLESTLYLMRDLERKALNEKAFQNFVYNNFVLTDCGVCIFRKIWQYMKGNFQYMSDTFDEVVISPARLLEIRKGDCDDFALFAHAILTMLAIDCKYMLLGSELNKFSHIAVLSNGFVIDGANENFNIISRKYKYFKTV